MSQPDAAAAAATTRFIALPSGPVEQDLVDDVIYWVQCSYRMLLISQVDPLMRTGHTRQVNQDDLPPYPAECEPTVCAEQLWHRFKELHDG